MGAIRTALRAPWTKRAAFPDPDHCHLLLRDRVIPTHTVYSYFTARSTPYTFASFQLTLIVGRRPRPQPSSAGEFEHLPARRHASHSAKVTLYRPTAKGRAIRTS